MTALQLPPEGRPATEPAEHAGLARDEVRLMAVHPTGVRHRRFRDLPGLLEPGDLVVVNTSPTWPARLDVRRADGGVVPLHVSTELDDGSWVVELRRPDNSGPDLGAEPGAVCTLPGGAPLVLRAPYPDPARPGRLWRADVPAGTRVAAELAAHGQPIRYGHLDRRFPLAAYQNVYAADPGGELASAEMASAGRPFTAALVVALLTRGVTVAPLTLHAGVASPELHEPPFPERFAVPEPTARLVTAARRAGSRVVAVGTTVTRALETATGEDGVTRAAAGWTDLVLGPDRPARAVSGLVTGLHEPASSHLRLLQAVAGDELVTAAYRAAADEGYRWHEFGDSMLFLP